MRAPIPRLLTAALLFGALGSWLALEFKTNARLYVKISPLREKAVQLAQVKTENRHLLAEVARLNALRREQADVVHSLALKRAEATGQPAPLMERWITHCPASSGQSRRVRSNRGLVPPTSFLAPIGDFYN